MHLLLMFQCLLGMMSHFVSYFPTKISKFHILIFDCGVYKYPLLLFSQLGENI